MRRSILVAATVALLGVVAAGAAQLAWASTGTSIALKPAQVGNGYALQTRADGHCVKGCVTLDMCGFDFTSEIMRTSRYQANYENPGSIPISNEIVGYSPGGAAEALSEIHQAVTTCPKRAVRSSVAGVGPLTYRINRLTDRRLLPGYAALRIHVAGTASGQKVDGTLISVYQVKGNYLSGVYTELGTNATVAQLTQLALHAAEGSAQNLKKYA